jgi:hypothetical protein
MTEQCSQILCKRCGQVKPITDYPRKTRDKHGYSLSACKTCANARRLISNREAHRAIAKTEAHRERQRNYQRAHPRRRVLNPLKRHAREAVREALRTGRIVKPRNCQDCGAQKRLDGHHADYSLPLKVEWLCASCHGVRHRIEHKDAIKQVEQ